MTFVQMVHLVCQIPRALRCVQFNAIPYICAIVVVEILFMFIEWVIEYTFIMVIYLRNDIYLLYDSILTGSKNIIMYYLYISLLFNIVQ